MTRDATVEPLRHMISFVNPEATGHTQAQARMEQVARYFVGANATADVLDQEASPFDLRGILNELTLAYSDGGDGTVRRVISAIVGFVPDNPEQTAKNFNAHAEVVPHLRYFAGAGGNANNWPLSAHGKYALHPERLASAQVYVGYHRPLVYEITEENGDIVRSNIATSGFGIGAAAIAAYRLEKAKSEFVELSNTRRLLGETAIVLDAARQAAPFSLDLAVVAADIGMRQFVDITGFELIKSKVYAKQGRTRVNVDDTKWQPVVLHHTSSAVREALQLMQMVARLKSGRHALPAEDLLGQKLSMRVTGDQPVQFHADGETDVDSIILPGQIIHMRLGQIAIPTLMAYS